MGKKRSRSCDTSSSTEEQTDAKKRLKKKTKKSAKLAKKEMERKKRKKNKKAKKLKKKVKKLRKLQRKVNGDVRSDSSSSSSSSSSSTHSICAEKPCKPPASEESRQSVGLTLFGELYARSKPDSKLKWVYHLRDEDRRCFVGLLQPELPAGTLTHLYRSVYDGAHWDQPKRPQTGEFLPRKTDWMVAERCRCKYRYGGVEVDPSEFPPWMEELLEVCMPLCGIRGRARWPNCCNLNLYEDGGMTVGWHADDEELFQGSSSDCPIVSFSLGQARTFELKPTDSKEGEPATCKIEIRSGDLLTMEGLTQKHYLHRVPRQKTAGPRINLTWRWIRKHQARCPLSR
eukprot:TRINITY_DN19023_c0_g1_i1.p1 TRINITY_DN19023_c0_g1~~TRINITY_DN19023_c0_g1_i1.p1  ORF type:complete len:343 (-),score=38.42 TRINITY_DN19023_c0_g1_i1:120-1148(-)